MSSIANKINEAFVSVMRDFIPLSDDAFALYEDDEPMMVTVDSVATRLSKVSSASRAGWGGGGWVRGILAPAVTEILNQSYRESKVPRIWKQAYVPPVPKGTSMRFQQRSEAHNFHAVQSRRVF